MIPTLIILLLSAVFFAIGKIRSDIVALCALIALLLLHILTPEEALSGFSNSIVIMMVGLFIVGGAIFQTGLAKMISARMLMLAGKSEWRLYLIIMLGTAAIGGFVSNTGTVAIMLPIVVSLASGAGMSPGRLLMPLAFASSMGGMMTLIGTPPNLVIENVLVEAGYPELSFFSFLPVGIVCISVGILLLWPLSKWFLSKGSSAEADGNTNRKSLHELVAEYGLGQNLFRIEVTPHSAGIGKTIVQLSLRSDFGLNVLEIRRVSTSRSKLIKHITQEMAVPATKLRAGDILYVQGDADRADKFAQANGMTLLASNTPEQPAAGTALDFFDIGIAEIVILSGSGLKNRTLKDAGFREKFGINVLGIRRKTQHILDNIADEKIKSGDVLLVQGTWKNISRLNNEKNEWVVLGEPLAEASKVTLDYKAPVAAMIMGLMICMMVFDFIPVAPVTAVLIAAVLMILTGCFRSVEAAYNTINWESVVLIAAMLPMSMALEKTGASTWVSDTLVSNIGSYGPLPLLAVIYFTTSLMTMFISNTATAVLLAPIAMHSAIQVGASPVPFLFAVAVGASMCFASPFSTPPNALVMPAGQYTFMDYIKVGVPLQIIMGIVMVIALPLIFPF